MSFNNVQSLNGVIRPHRIVNVNSNVTTNPNSNLSNLNPYINQNSVDINKYKLGTINIEKTSLELALNILKIEHNTFEGMTKHEFIYYYDNFKKQNSNVNHILASNIALKYKLDKHEPVNSGLLQNYNPEFMSNSQSNFYQPDRYQQDVGLLQGNGNSNGYQNQNQYLQQNSNNSFQNKIQNQSFNKKNSNDILFDQKLNTGIESNKQYYGQTMDNTSIQKTKSSINQMNGFQDFKPSYRPVQNFNSNSNQYLNSTINQSQSQPKSYQDNVSKDFDLNSIIDNYSKQKNNGVGKNLDVSYNIPTNLSK